MIDTQHAIVVSDLQVTRGGKPILPGVSLTVKPGVVTGLLGPSGSGKTTLMRSIVGVQIVESGTVTILGEPIPSPSSSRVRLGAFEYDGSTARPARSRDTCCIEPSTESSRSCLL
jgi:ABC-2 type transport system ATP-binding protein